MSILLPSVEAILKDNGLDYEALECDPDFADTASFCERYNFNISQAANTLLVEGKSETPKYAVCLMLATTKLDVNKAVCRLLEVKRTSFASAEKTIELTGMMLGGVTALGVSGLPIYVDRAVMDQPKIVMGGGNRSSKVLLNPKELTRLPNLKVVEDLAKPKQE